MDSTADKAPVPVTSAKAALNAMLAHSEPQPAAQPLAPSARELVNAAASQNAAQRSKSAANLHHGSIQRNLESTRTSASALLRRSEEDSSSTKPVVRTSLKLGANARPKPAPVVLPPHSRMAQQARPTTDSQNGELSVQIISASKSNALKSQLPELETQKIARPAARVLPRSAGARNIRDPQMLPARGVSLAPRRPVSGNTAPAVSAPVPARPASATPRANNPPRSASGAPRPSLLAMRPAAQAHFRSAPKGDILNRPGALPVDNSYVMATPPKITVRSAANVRKDMAELGIVDEDFEVEEFFAPSALPEASRDDGVYRPTHSVKTPATDGHYALDGESPFLKSVSVEKRPLSGGMPRPAVTNYGQTESEQLAKAAKAAKSSKTTKSAKPKKSAKSTKSTKTKSARKNQYSDHAVATPTLKTHRQDKINRPTVIIPSGRRSKAPLFFLIVLTIILGAAVGAAAYLCFFQ